MLKKRKVNDGHAIVIPDCITDLEEWPIKVRVPATVGELAEQPGCSSLSSRSRAAASISLSSSSISLSSSSSSSSSAQKARLQLRS